MKYVDSVKFEDPLGHQRCLENMTQEWFAGSHQYWGQWRGWSLNLQKWKKYSLGGRGGDSSSLWKRGETYKGLKVVILLIQVLLR